METRRCDNAIRHRLLRLALAVAMCFFCLPARSILAQETITNVAQFSAILDQPGILYPLVEPYELSRFTPMGTWYFDFEQITNALAAVRSYPGQEDCGGTMWPLRLTRYADSGEIVVGYGTNDIELLRELGPPNLEQYARVFDYWSRLTGKYPASYDDLVADSYTFLYPPRIVADVWAVDVNYATTCESNMMAEVDDGAQFMEGESLSIDGAFCSVTNLTQPFSILSVEQNTNLWTTLTWESCPIFRYLVLSADELSTNTVWLERVYIWGEAGSASWTDTTTTNLTDRFYKVRRLLGSRISAGGFHSLAVRPDGTLWGWGADDDGQLGDRTTGDPLPFYDTGIYKNRPFPVETADPISCDGQTISNAVSVAAGPKDFTVVADADGRVWTWGSSNDGLDGDVGVLGDGGSRPLVNGNVFVPSPISGVSNVVNVAAGNAHVLALRADGTVWAWGYDVVGQLGVGGLSSPNYTNSPVQSLVITQAVAVSAGAEHNAALDVNGRVWTWGRGNSGRLGNGGTANVTTPTTLTNIANVIAIAAGRDHTTALTVDKTVWTWGDNSKGQLGRSGTTATPGQVLPSVLSNVVAIASGYQFTLAVTSNGNVYAWGDNIHGQLGTNTSAVGSTNSPMLVTGISHAVLVSASAGNYDDDAGYQSMAMTVDQGTNRYWGWGRNNHGQVGNGTNAYNADQYAPVPVQFCTRCERSIQLGTNGSFTAHCTGTLVLYFNDEQGAFSDNAGSFTVTVDGFSQTNVPAFGDGGEQGFSPGVAIGTVTNGGVYTYSASGLCQWDINCSACFAEANGNLTNGAPANCTSINMTNSICPAAKCFSLVGKIQ